MALIFHQNMENYTGTNGTRTAAYAAGFGAINGLIPMGQSYWVAGFTELLRSHAVLRANLSGLAQILDPNLGGFCVIEVGTTSVGVRREFIGIAWDAAALTVQHLGHVLYDPVNKVWRGFDTLPGAVVNQTILLPNNVALAGDTRGLAYVAAQDPAAGNYYVFGFMHNMYNEGNKSGAFSSLGVMCARLVVAMNDPNYTLMGTSFYLGGDFNVRPRQPTRRGGRTLFVNARRAGGAVGPPAAYVNTTNWHPYDYFVDSDFTRNDSHVRVLAQTRVANCSDHAGVDLTF